MACIQHKLLQSLHGMRFKSKQKINQISNQINLNLSVLNNVIKVTKYESCTDLELYIANAGDIVCQS